MKKTFSKLWVKVVSCIAVVFMALVIFVAYKNYESYQQRQAAIAEREVLRKKANQAQYDRWKNEGVKMPDESKNKP
jgi:hypothetical protein